MLSCNILNYYNIVLQVPQNWPIVPGNTAPSLLVEMSNAPDILVEIANTSDISGDAKTPQYYSGDVKILLILLEMPSRYYLLLILLVR
jgi:hypothetical protein